MSGGLTPDPRVAIFVDGENVSSSHAAAIRKAAQGRVVICRTYGDATKMNGWREAAGFSVVHSGSGNNSADILLAVDALELALEGRFDTCVLATSDGGLRHLAVRLRERGMTVTGVGEAKAPCSFRQLCSEFKELKSNNVATDNSLDPNDIEREALKTIKRLAGDQGDVVVSKLATEMNTLHGVRKGDLPERNWSSFLSARPNLFTVGEANTKVRLTGDTVHLSSVSGGK